MHSLKNFVGVWIVYGLLASGAMAQPPIPSLAESDAPGVARQELPNPLITLDGVDITTTSAWREVRRPEILELFRTHVYGRTPEGTVEMNAEVFDEDRNALGGKAIRKQVAIHLGRGGKSMRVDLLLFLPVSAERRPVPVLTLLNFSGNHAVHDDPAIAFPRGPVPLRFRQVRGAKSERFRVEAIVARGFGLATAYCGDIALDTDASFQTGAHVLFGTPTDRAGDTWGTLGAWAWGLSRILDYLETDPDVDAQRVAVLGHSRLGKTALWAGAQDERFAIVISNNSGSGGAALARNKKGERIKDATRKYLYWYCTNYLGYSEREGELPVDQHMLLSLIAPRPVYVASASEDAWADPEGEFLSCIYAGPVYRLFGLEGVSATEFPPPDTPLHRGTIGYHLRTGKHGLTPYDFEQYMTFAEACFRDGKNPFETIDLPFPEIRLQTAP